MLTLDTLVQRHRLLLNRRSFGFPLVLLFNELPSFLQVTGFLGRPFGHSRYRATLFPAHFKTNAGVDR